MGLDSGTATRLLDWLLQVPHVADGGQSFTRGLAEQLRALGLPVWRLSLALLTKHPELLWRTLRWSESEGVTSFERAHRTSLDPFFTRSPVALLVQGAAPIRVRLLVGEDADAFPVCRDLRDQGGTDYYALGLPFANGEISYVSLATRDATGFSADALALLDAVRTQLARRLELESAYHATGALLEVYLGRNAARRVLGGAFKRGGGELIQAAIWFCDLRGFTEKSDRMSAERVVQMLDAYFECVAGAIGEHGGEVLKFVGDAILAIFPSNAQPSEACQRAVRAADQALAALSELNAARPAEEHLSIGIALHLGEVMYGNIGSRDRLDFTVISASVNETCRLEALCKPLGTPLTLSEAFVRSLPNEAVRDLGEYELKGVQNKLRVFTLERYRAS